MIAKLLPLALLGALASCAAVAPDPFLTTQAVAPEAPQAVSDVSAEFAAAYLPTYAGGIQSVRQKVAHKSLHQEIVYANQTSLPGENMLTVNAGATDDGAFIRPPSIRQVTNEMRAALPGLTIVMSPVIGNNGNGVYGYATATVRNGSCIYAWQFVKPAASKNHVSFSKFTRSHLATSIRLRYCHPSIPADRIHVLMDGMRVKDINDQTIDMLRFAAGSADVIQPQAVVTSEPVIVPRRKVVRQAAVTREDDWRQAPREKVTEDAQPAVIDNAAAVPLPDSTADQRVTVPVESEVKSVQTKRIPDAAEVPLPE